MNRMPEAVSEPTEISAAMPEFFRLGPVNSSKVKDILHQIQKNGMEDPRSAHQLLSLFQPEEFTSDEFHILSPNTKPQTLWDQVAEAASNERTLTGDQKIALMSIKHYALQSLAEDPQEHVMRGGQKRVLNESVRDAARVELQEYDAYVAKILDPEDPASARFFDTAKVVGKVMGKMAEAGGTGYLVLNLMGCVFGGPIPSAETSMPPAITAQAIESNILNVGKQISIVTGDISIQSSISSPDCTPGASTQPLIIELAGSSTEQPLPLAICSAGITIGETSGQGALFTEVHDGQIGKTYIAFGEGSQDQRHGELVPIIDGIADRQSPDRLRYEITTDGAGNVTGMDIMSPAGNGGPYHVAFDQAGGSPILGLFSEALGSIVLHSDISIADATATPVPIPTETPTPTEVYQPRQVELVFAPDDVTVPDSCKVVPEATADNSLTLNGQPLPDGTVIDSYEGIVSITSGVYHQPTLLIAARAVAIEKLIPDPDMGRVDPYLLCYNVKLPSGDTMVIASIFDNTSQQGFQNTAVYELPGADVAGVTLDQTATQPTPIKVIRNSDFLALFTSGTIIGQQVLLPFAYDYPSTDRAVGENSWRGAIVAALKAGRLPSSGYFHSIYATPIGGEFVVPESLMP
jgi:hypothetical protein